MAQETSQQTGKTTPGTTNNGRLEQAVTGVVPPQLGEALIREAWPTVMGVNAGLALLAKKLIQTVFLAPIGWLLLAPLFVKRLAPYICRRYTLTNRRLMIRLGLKPEPVSEVPLDRIDDVRCEAKDIDAFYLSGTLEVISAGQVVLTLPGVPEPEGFRQAILNARRAWGRSATETIGPFVPASAADAKG